jgi:pyruvate/2-oxoglutarate dehydrogenase complex dihydrolipoamide acyltransferase (E2) component
MRAAPHSRTGVRAETRHCTFVLSLGIDSPKALLHYRCMATYNSTRRKLAIATWSAPQAGVIYGQLGIDMSAALLHIEKLRAESGLKISITHLVGKAVALGLRAAPGLNGRIHLGKFIAFDSVDFSYLVALEEGGDLGKVKIESADETSVIEIAQQLADAAAKLRAGKDDDFNKSKPLLRLLPTWLLRPIAKMTGWLAGSLGARIRFLGVEPFPFGACCVTSVGMFGIEVGYAPHTPWARTPMLITICQIKDQVVALDGEAVVRPILTITATIDHRFIDGFAGGKFAKTVRRVLEDPQLLDA